MWLRVSGRKVFLVGISVIIVGKWWTRTCLVELYPFCWFTIPVKLKNNAFCFFCFFNAAEKCICKGIWFWDFSVYFPCFLPICLVLLLVLWLPPTAQRRAFGERWIGSSKLALGLNVSVNCCFFSMLAWRAGDLSRVYYASCLKAAEIGSSHFATSLRDKAVESGWMVGICP